MKRLANLFFVCSNGKTDDQERTVPDIDHIRGEIERRRTQVHRQRGGIRQLQRAGLSTASADALLERMLNKIDELCEQRDRLKKDLPPVRSKVLGARKW
jgi:hypothetical protein